MEILQTSGNWSHCTLYDMVISFDALPECDGQTDGHSKYVRCIAIDVTKTKIRSTSRKVSQNVTFVPETYST